MTPPPDSLDDARATRDGRRAELSRAHRAQADAERALRDALRAFGADDRRSRKARVELADAIATTADVRTSHQAAREEFGAGLRDRLRGAIEDDFAALNTSAPLVLLPVRLETRFAIGGREKELWIRVYPDEIHGDGHEPELTDAEVTAGKAYWDMLWDDGTKGAAAWKILVEELTAPRAAWVASRLMPLNPDADHATNRPQFPAPPLRTDEWTRAVEARLLPDRWVAIGMRAGVEVKRAHGNPITEPLALTAAPDADDGDFVDLSGDGLDVEKGILWTVDFEKAHEAGMAVRMPVSADDVALGFDELLVFGVKGSLGESQAGTALGALFDAHHYQRGLAFLRQGTPTNNTQAAPSGFPPADPDALLSLSIERDDQRSIAGRDGERLAAAFGVSTNTFVHVDRSDADEQAGARAMCGALWPATWGYFFEELLFEDDHDEDVERFRDYFIDHVRPRGPLPAFRVGSTPYGVVVASSLTHWLQRNHRGMLQFTMPLELRRLREIWRQQLQGVARVGRSNDPDRDLLDVLEMDASAREVRVRSVLGPNASFNMGAFFGLDWDSARAEQFRLAQDLAALLGRSDVASRVYSLLFGKQSAPFVSGFVVPRPKPETEEPLSETEGLSPFNYIRWLREAPSIDAIRDEQFPEGVAPPRTLLYRLLRHAMMREAARGADGLLIREGLLDRAMARDVEFPGASKAPGSVSGPGGVGGATPTPWQRMQVSIPAITGNLTVAGFVWAENSRVREFRDYLRVLESLPTAELERLLTETLDVCSHRLDAWVTAMFTDRLRALRQSDVPRTIIGGFGWVADLKATPAVARAPKVVGGLDDLMRRRLELPHGATLDEQVSSGGYIHAPSMTQAATAAVLRNGYLSRRHVNGDRYGVDLSSARVRQARWVLDAVRNGQPLGAVLGYQFERGLHEEHPGLDLDKFIEPFRREYPLSGGELTPTASDEPAEAVAARNVVDGLKLHAAFKAQPQEIPFGQRGLPPSSGTHFDAVNVELHALDETIDSLADLLLAESVYQLVRGNTAGAAASLDTLSRGARPPDPEVIRSPRGGSALIHRVALVLDAAAALPASWAGSGDTERSRAEPHIDAWLAGLIGDPAVVRCAVTYKDPAGLVIGPIEVTLAQLGLRAIDVYHVVTSDVTSDTRQPGMPNTTAQGSELDERIAAVVLARADADRHGEVKIQYAPGDRAATRSFPEMAELMRAVQSVLSTARELQPRDLVAGTQRDLLASAVVDQAELQGRAAVAVQALTDSKTALDAAITPLDVDPVPVTKALRTALVSAMRGASALGVPGSFVASPHDEPDAAAGSEQPQRDRVTALVARAKGVAGELAKRSAAAGAALTPQDRLAEVFGASFTALTRFVPATAALAQPLTSGPTPAPSRADVREWVRGAAMVRAPLDRWHALTQVAGAMGAAPLPMRVTQLPFAPGARWIAQPFPDEAQRPPSGTVGLALLRTKALPAADQTWVGILLDEWTEIIPNREESTAVAFHYDDPGAEAPQAVLIAVAPDDRENWSLETVRDVLHETLELARLRAVDGDLLGSMSQMLPATFLAANPRRDTIATTFKGQLAKDRVIAAGP